MTDSRNDTMTPEFHGWTRCPDCGEYTDTPHDHDPVGIESKYMPWGQIHTVLCTEHAIRQTFWQYRNADRFAHAHRDTEHA